VQLCGSVPAVDVPRTVGEASRSDVVAGLSIAYGLTKQFATTQQDVATPANASASGAHRTGMLVDPRDDGYVTLGALERAYKLELPCGVPSRTRPEAQYVYMPTASTWDCFPGETIHHISHAFRSPCVCREPEQTTPAQTEHGMIAGLLLLPLIAGVAGWTWDNVFGRATPSLAARVLMSGVLFAMEEVAAYVLAHHFRTVGYLGYFYAIVGCLFLLRACQVTISVASHLIPPQPGHVVLLGSAAEAADGEGIEAMVMELLPPLLSSTSVSGGVSTAAALGVQHSVVPAATEPPGIRLLVRCAGSDVNHPRVVEWHLPRRTRHNFRAPARHRGVLRHLFEPEGESALLGGHASQPSSCCTGVTPMQVRSAGSFERVEAYASSTPGRRRWSPLLDPFGMRRLPCWPHAVRSHLPPRGEPAGILPQLLAGLLSVSGLAPPIESLVCFATPEPSYFNADASPPGASEALCELRLAQALFLSAPLFLLQMLCLTIEGFYSALMLGGAPAAVLPLLSLTSYSLAGAGYLRALGTHHTRRVVAPLCDSSAVGRLLELHLASDLSLRALGFAIFVSALGPQLRLLGALLMAPVFIVWARSDLAALGGAARAGKTRAAACVPRFWSRLVAPHLLLSPVFLSHPHLPTEVLYDTLASTAACLTLVWCGLSPRMPNAHTDADFKANALMLATAAAAAKAATFGWCAIPALTGHYPVLLATRLDTSRQPGRFGRELLFVRALLNALTCGILSACVSETFHPGWRSGPNPAFGGASYRHGVAKGVPEPPSLRDGLHSKPEEPKVEASTAAKRLQATTLH